VVPDWQQLTTDNQAVATMALSQLSAALFLQVLVILVVARAAGTVAHRYLGQPRVVGEMLAGIVLGPSVFGLVAPAIQTLVFPPDTKPILFVLAQLGVGLYMFLVGLAFDRDDFRNNARSAVSVSLAGIAVPFAAALLLAPLLVRDGDLFRPGVTTFEASLFLGAAIAITAFPMLARIIHERNLSGTAIGSISLSAGAIDDAMAWVLIAIVLASLGAGASTAWTAVLSGSAFAALCVFGLPRVLALLFAGPETAEHQHLAMALVLFLAAAWSMDAAGIHAVFGGFLLGTALPRGPVTERLRGLLEPLTVVFFLPLFFTYSGLHTDLSGLASVDRIALTALIVLASILAKGGACYGAARLAGRDHGASLGIAALMNARGLMELIVINIGLQRGIIGPGLFAMLTLMAVITTLMATPLFDWSQRLNQQRTRTAIRADM
jgi:Kef-type K+ transport system membrane component KefB